MANVLPGAMDNVFRSQSPAPGGPSPVLEFRAGKLYKSGRTVRPDRRKGLVQLWVEETGLKLKWLDRRSQIVEDDIFLFPGEVTWQRVPQCTTGRVYVLDFGPRQLFFWMQEPDAEQDDQYAKKINEYIEDPGKARREDARRSHEAAAASGVPSVEQLLQLLQAHAVDPGDPGPQTAPGVPFLPRAIRSSPPPGGNEGGSISDDTLANILADMGVLPESERPEKKRTPPGTRVRANLSGSGWVWCTVVGVTEDGSVRVQVEGSQDERLIGAADWAQTEKEFST
eukprot:Hpha_TRINITY_DN11906_c0_g1::TRINITY_DN11906_c0_g1_i1::g.20832::m.20832/K06691/RPN13; 26S proteasome regulatory subunit N13